jgi:hypothetical protein
MAVVTRDVVMAILQLPEAALVEPRCCHEGSRSARSVHVCTRECPTFHGDVIGIRIRTARFTLTA